MTPSSLSSPEATAVSHKFLVEILGMTNYCNLHCAYCDWEKKPPMPLTDGEKANMQRNLIAARSLIQSCWPEAPMIEYSGGEPFLYPEIVIELLRVFPDRWIRIVTNGLLIGPQELDAISRHGKAFLAISLDGHTLESNINRFHSDDLRKMVVNNVDNALDANIPVMLLCTLNRFNIDCFPQYMAWIHHRWPKQIENGSLVLPAHKLSVYDNYHPVATEQQWGHLVAALHKLDLPGISRIREHYDAMSYSRQSCAIYRWAASMHFLDRAIVEEEGTFTTYRCGMRGVHKIGSFSVNSSDGRELCSTALAKAEKINLLPEQCRCFVDWTAFDLILSGVIPAEQAAAWFRPFQSPLIQKWIANHHAVLSGIIRK